MHRSEAGPRWRSLHEVFDEHATREAAEAASLALSRGEAAPLSPGSAANRAGQPTGVRRDVNGTTLHDDEQLFTELSDVFAEACGWDAS